MNLDALIAKHALGRVTRLENTTGSSQKFWECWVAGSTFWARWGRIGDLNGQTNAKPFHSEVEARDYLTLKVNEKLAKGYVHHSYSSMPVLAGAWVWPGGSRALPLAPRRVLRNLEAKGRAIRAKIAEIRSKREEQEQLLAKLELHAELMELGVDPVRVVRSRPHGLWGRQTQTMIELDDGTELVVKIHPDRFHEWV